MKNIFDIEDDLNLDLEEPDNSYLEKDYKLHIVSELDGNDKEEHYLYKVYQILDIEEINYYEVKSREGIMLYLDNYISSYRNAVKLVRYFEKISYEFDVYDNHGHDVPSHMHPLVYMLTGNFEHDFSTMFKKTVENYYKNCEQCLDLRHIDVSEQTIINFKSITSIGVIKHFTSIDIRGWNTSKLKFLSFDGFDCVTEIKGIEDIDTSNIIDMREMFFNCGNLKSLDLSKWNTSRVRDMKEMFYNCSNLETLNVTGWDTSKVTDMSSMFMNCSVLKYVDVSGWNTSNVRKMYYMFRNCNCITGLDVSKWNTSKVTNMKYMFNFCERILELDTKNWDTSKVRDMSGMFRCCYNLNKIDVSNWDTSNVYNMSDMFYSCEWLEKLDTSKWDFTNVDHTERMFMYCKHLTELDVKNWDMSNVKFMDDMFKNCKLPFRLEMQINKFYDTVSHEKR